MWIVQVALKRPYTFVVLAVLIAIDVHRRLRSKPEGPTEPTEEDLP